jgi:hypothetical protein
MPDQIYIGNFPQGQVDNILPFNIDNAAFPNLYNFFVWRGRAKKKRGTATLARLQVQIKSVLSPTLPWQYGPLTLIGGVGNLITGPWTQGLSATTFSLDANSSITPGTISVIVGANTYTEPSTPNGILIGTPAGSGSINYATGLITIVGGGVGPLTGTFSYYPNLPVLGLEDVIPNIGNANFPIQQSFDPIYSYQINQSSATPFYYTTDYYKYSNNQFYWSNTDDKQFWSTNYQSAFWVTNDKPGLHFVNGTYVSGTGTSVITFTFTSNSVPYATLVAGTATTADQLWFNEWPSSSTINGLVGYVSAVVNAATGTYQVTFPNNVTVSSTGIAQLLTNSIIGQDGIKWYDGDPTSGTGLPTVTGLGWVNFAPPLTALTVGIADQNPALYYLVGALAIIPTKDRLLFFRPQIQSSNGSVIVLQDTVLWSWNGTPYYNSLVPTNTTNSETSNVKAYYVDQTGYGGYLPAGISQPIMSVTKNEDVILIGFGGIGTKTRFLYTGNDLQPFLFYLINSALPSSCTFSALTFDAGAIEIGTYGITLTTQQSCDRIDLVTPDSVFKIQNLNNGQNRVNAIRDFYREWVYFSYPLQSSNWKYPTQSFFFNYRENTWAIFRENFTHHGTFRRQTKNTWASIGKKFGSWANWREPWNSGSGGALFPQIIAGNPQGFVLIKDQGTGEAPSGTIAAIANDGFGFTQITSINHCVNAGSNKEGTYGDYLYFLSSIGTNPYLNGKIGLVTKTIDANNFIVDIPFQANTYLGLGTYTRLIQPLLQTKQFPMYWDQGRKCILKAQKYLLGYTANSQITLNINLSQDPDDIWNAGNIVPSQGVLNSGLEYSQTLYTCPESSNLGLSPANTNLQMPTAQGQYQIWHRSNTSLIGDSIQLGFTLSDAQMRNLTYATDEITLHGIHLTVEKGPHLA